MLLLKYLAKITTTGQRSLSLVTRQETTKMKKGSGQFLKSLRSSENQKRKREGVDIMK
jgi:hypothetical protein